MLTPSSPLGRYRQANPVGGLTLVEVIVGMLVAAICLGTALQSYVAAVSIKVKAQQMNTAVAKIDADAETIRQMSQVSQVPPNTCPGNYAQILMSKVHERDAESTPIGGAELPDDKSETPEHTEGLPPSTSQSFQLPLSELPSDYQLERKMSVEPNTPKVLKVAYTLTRSPHGEAEDSTPITQLSLAIMPRDALLCP